MPAQNISVDLKMVIDSTAAIPAVRWGVKDNQAFYEIDDRIAQVEI